MRENENERERERTRTIMITMMGKTMILERRKMGAIDLDV
jgi:hypothetical protein